MSDRMDILKERVERGAELLDREFEADWPSRIDTETLNIASNCDCILGQLGADYYKGYDAMLDDLVTGDEHAYEYGFTREVNPYIVPSEFGDLTDLWIDLIEELKEAK